MFRKALKIICFCFFVVAAGLLLFEFAFRIQLIDFYKNELTALNPHLKKGEQSILIFGDSFTAHIDSYVSFLRQSNPEVNIVNCGIAGSGIRQHELFSDQRIADYNPQQHLIYQFYVGNDFQDIKHPLNYNSISLSRNVYWWLANQLLGIHYLNFRMAFLRASNQKTELVRSNDFSPRLYNQREKLQFTTKPNYLENSINIVDTELNLYTIWKEKFKRLIQDVDPNVQISLLVIPHCAQVNTAYQNRMERMGAIFKANIQEVNYPLIEKLRKDFPEVIIINPLSTFQREDHKETNLYYENDPHLTTEGQEVLAKILDDRLF